MGKEILEYLGKINFNMDFIQTILISIISSSVVVFLSYFLGFRSYIRERGREEVREEYIKNGIDRIIEILDKACFTCQFNHAKAIRILEYLKKSAGDTNIEKEITQKIFSEMQPLIIAPENSIYKLQFLTGKNKILSSFAWIVEVIADYLRYNDYLRYELFFELQHYFGYPDKFRKDKQDFFDKLQKRVIDIYSEVVPRNEMIRVYLLSIRRRIDEIGISKIKDLNKISEDEKIKEILGEIQKDYEGIKKKKNK